MADLQTKIEISAEDHASAALNSVSDRVTNLGNASKVASVAIAGAVASIGVALVGLGKAAFDLGESFDASYDKIRVGTGATGERLEQFKQQFRDVASGVPDSFDAVSSAIVEVNRRIGASDEQAGILATTFLDLSRITGTDLNETIRLSGRLFGDWGGAVSKQVETMDLLFRATQKTGVPVNNLQQLLVQYGAPLRQLGFGLNEAIALLAKFEAEGVNTELVMGSLRIVLGKLAEAGIPLKEGFAEVSRQIKEAKTDSEGTSLAIQAFGARAGPDMAAAIREGRFEVSGLVADLSQATDTISGATTETEDARERMGRAWNQIKLAAEPVAEVVFSVAGAIAEGLGVALINVGPEISDFIKSLSPDSEEAAKGAAEKVNELETAIRGLAEPVTTTANAVKTFAGFSAAADSSLGGLVATAKGALNPLSQIKTALSGLQTVGDILGTVGNVLDQAGRATPIDPGSLLTQGEAQRNREEAERNWRTWAEGQAAAAAAGVDEALEGVDDALAGAGAGGTGGGGARPDISALFKPAGSGKKAKDAGHEVALSAIDGFISGMQGAEADMEATFGALGGKLATALNNAVASNTGGQAVRKSMEDLITALREAGVEDWRGLGNSLSDALHDALVARTPESVQAARDLIGQLSRTIDEAQFWQQWAKAGEQAADRVNTALQSAADKITDTYRSAKERIQGIWDNLELTRKLEDARKRVEDVLASIRGAQDEGTRQIQSEREARDVATNRLREDADRRAAQEQRIADIRKSHSATMTQDIRAAQQAFDRETAQLDQRRAREDADRRLRGQDQAQDIARAAGNQQNITTAQQTLEQALGIDAAQLRRMEAARQSAALWDEARKKERDFNNELVATQERETQFLETTYNTLIQKFSQLAPYLTGTGPVPPGNGGEAAPSSRQIDINNYGIIVDMPTFARLTMDAENRTAQGAVATQGA